MNAKAQTARTLVSFKAAQGAVNGSMEELEAKSNF